VLLVGCVLAFAANLAGGDDHPTAVQWAGNRKSWHTGGV
jgi:hypothetical protein